ncbi:hypothetical protein LXL04_024718 [Taraxacum kok-saghyz]
MTLKGRLGKVVVQEVQEIRGERLGKDVFWWKMEGNTNTLDYTQPKHISSRISFLLYCSPFTSLSLIHTFLQLTEFTPISTSYAMKGGKSKSDTKKADSRLAVKKKAAPAPKKAPAKKAKEAKDPNKPKRPASAFFVFIDVGFVPFADPLDFDRNREDFRKQYKEKHPNNKSVSVVGKAGGDKWKSLSAAEKAPYAAKAEKRKAEYEKTLQAYNKKLAEGKDAEEEEEEESDKSKSEVHDDEEDEDDSADDDDDEDDE